MSSSDDECQAVVHMPFLALSVGTEIRDSDGLVDCNVREGSQHCAWARSRSAISYEVAFRTKVVAGGLTQDAVAGWTQDLMLASDEGQRRPSYDEALEPIRQKWRPGDPIPRRVALVSDCAISRLGAGSQGGHYDPGALVVFGTKPRK